ncbi:hypothetical protein BVY03_03530 [bacterium K02(2017)]|nr:hypothetical protein BVY03_03530 [bacterium K02(2017)]
MILKNTYQKFKDLMTLTVKIGLSYPAIIQAIHLAEFFNAEIFIVHAISEDQNPAFDKMKILNRILWHQTQHEFLEKAGDVIDIITKTSDELNPDLILMGTHSDQTQKSFTIEIVKKSSCPVWVIHPEK